MTLRSLVRRRTCELPGGNSHVLLEGDSPEGNRPLVGTLKSREDFKVPSHMGFSMGKGKSHVLLEGGRPKAYRPLSG